MVKGVYPVIISGEHDQLHTWEPGDDFLRTEFNEDFEALDGAARIICGVYTGDETSERFIDLGFTPRVILVQSNPGVFSNVYGVALEGLPALATSTQYTGSKPDVTVVEGALWSIMQPAGSGWSPTVAATAITIWLSVERQAGFP